MQSLRRNASRSIGRIFLAAMAVALAGCQNGGEPFGLLPSGWTHQAKADGALADRAALEAIGLQPYWQVRLSMVDGDRATRAQLIGDQLIVLTAHNACYAVDAARGGVRGPELIEKPDVAGLADPTVDGFRYYLAGPIRIVGLDKVSLAADYQIKLEQPASTPAVCDADFVYVGASDGRVFAYNIKNRMRNWHSKVGPMVTGLGLSMGHLIVARSDLKLNRGEVYSLRPAYWDEDWVRPFYTEGPISAPILSTPEAIYVASEDCSLYRINNRDGYPQWRARTPGVLRDPPVLLKDRLVQTAAFGTWVIDRDAGLKEDKPLWQDKAVLRYLGQSGTRMYLFDDKAGIVCKDSASGKTLGSAAITAGGKVVTAPNPDQSKLYLVTEDGRVLCCEDRGQPYITVGQSAK